MTLFGSLTAPPGNPSPVKLSAEERLLQVIQNGGESPASGKRRLFGEFYQRIRSALGPRGHRPDREKAPGSNLVRLNKTLEAVLVLGLILSVANLFLFRPDIGRMHSRVASANTPQGHPAFKPISVEELLGVIGSRNLFQPKIEEVLPVVPSGPAAELSGILENLQLVGIAWGAQPEAMIREKKEGRTFFLKTGDQLKGVTVKEILKDRVIVEYEGQTKEIM